jgi:hypothetical protein
LQVLPQVIRQRVFRVGIFFEDVAEAGPGVRLVGEEESRFRAESLLVKADYKNPFAVFTE